jgi:hypothetical protein
MKEYDHILYSHAIGYAIVNKQCGDGARVGLAEVNTTIGHVVTKPLS